jgi:hypothetical protein
VLFEGVKMSGVGILHPLATTTLRYELVALRRVQNVPAVEGTVPGIVRELNVVVEM